MAARPAAQSAPRTAALDLPDALVRRLALLACVALGIAAALNLRQWQARQQQTLPATAELVARYLADDVGRRIGAFDRGSFEIHLQALAPLAERLPFCVDVRDIAVRPLAEGCLPAGDTPPLVGRVAAWVRTPARASRALVLPGGITVGSVTVTPHWPAETALLMQGWTAYALLLLIAAAMVASVWFMVRQALKPASQVLAALGRLADGDTTVRLPRHGYAEFDRIATALNQAVDSVARVQAGQRHLATALLQTREAERRRLARELHDELGQSLAALNAEAAALRRLLRGQGAAAEAGTQAIGELGARMLDELQRVLADLRPAALDRFGLPLALQALVDQPRPRSGAAALVASLHWAGTAPAAWTALPHDGDSQVYRIVQEALANAWRHGTAPTVQVRVRRDAVALELRIDEAAAPSATPSPTPPAARRPHGLEGIRERAQALGGDAHWGPAADDGGWQVVAHWPLAGGGEAWARW